MDVTGPLGVFCIPIGNTFVSKLLIQGISAGNDSMVFARFLTAVFAGIHLATLLYTAVALIQTPQPAVAGLLLMALSPLVQRVFKLDSLHVVHHKVRLPATTLAVLSGLALILVSADKESAVMGLAFLNLAAFILDTYWLKR